jgi:hypothetical protein
VFESRTFVDVVDGELDDGVFAVEGIDVGSRALEVGEEPEVAPVGPQRRLGSLNRVRRTIKRYPL